MIPYTVRCYKCGEVLYDSCTGEHYLQNHNATHGQCPGCGTTYSIQSILRQPEEDE